MAEELPLTFKALHEALGRDAEALKPFREVQKKADVEARRRFKPDNSPDQSPDQLPPVPDTKTGQ